MSSFSRVAGRLSSKFQPPTSKNDAPPALSWSLGDWKFIGAHSAVAQGRLWMLEFGAFFGTAKDSRVLQHLLDRGVAGENAA